MLTESITDKQDLYDSRERAASRKRSIAHMKELRRRHMIKNAVIIALMVIAFCSGFFGRGLLNAHAEEEISPELNCYYGSVQIRRGDTLWNIAENYSGSTGYNTKEYVEELKRINHLDSEEIHAGEYLTVLYYE